MSESGASRGSKALRELPSVDEVLNSPQVGSLVDEFGRSQTVEALRAALNEVREQIKTGELGESQAPYHAMIMDRAALRLEEWNKPTLGPVINATGVVLHTNLGRSPLSHESIEAMRKVAEGYSNLEYDLEKGTRGSRLFHAEALLQRLTGAEAALVVNNNAAALLLALTALTRRKRVVISRSQLVEIGGGFRLPEVMSQSGAKLVEVGTTNRVHLRDYEEALEAGAALVLRAHHSNFRITGFTSEVSLSEMAQTAHRWNIPLLDDLGSGVLLDTARFGLVHEPTVQESLAAGADLVCFSGDKLLGGPQAGILLGRAELIAKLIKHPLARAIRADKLCLSALGATLLHYLRDEAVQKIPIWRMISTTQAQCMERSVLWSKRLGTGEVIEGRSTVGGGSLPEEILPTCLLALEVRQPNRFLASLRQLTPPIIARVENDRVVFDPRTILPEQDDSFLGGIEKVLKIS